MSKFTVGQKVRINTNAYVKTLQGQTGTITEVGMGCARIDFDAGEVPGWGTGVTLREVKFDLIEAKPSLADDLRLPPQGRTVLNHMRKQGSISAADAMLSYGMTSAVLTRRICDIENIGYAVTRESKKHPTSGRRYTRYSLAA